MVKYPSANIRVAPLTPDRIRSLGNLKGYLEIKGDAYHQNMDNPSRKEFHYFIDNSVVFIRDFKTRSDISIVSPSNSSLNRLKISIDNLLNGH